MFKKMTLLALIFIAIALPNWAFDQEDWSYTDIIALLDSIAIRQNEVEEIMVSYIFDDTAIQSPEFSYALLYFETTGWNYSIVPLLQEGKTFILFFSPQVALIRSLNQSLLGALFNANS